MKTIGKTLENDKVIVELTQKDVEMLLFSVNSYCVRLNNLGYMKEWRRYSNLEGIILDLEKNMK